MWSIEDDGIFGGCGGYGETLKVVLLVALWCVNRRNVRDWEEREKAKKWALSRWWRWQGFVCGCGVGGWAGGGVLNGGELGIMVIFLCHTTRIGILDVQIGINILGSFGKTW